MARRGPIKLASSVVHHMCVGLVAAAIVTSLNEQDGSRNGWFKECERKIERQLRYYDIDVDEID